VELALRYTDEMATSILATKLYLPPPRPKVVLRPRLIERLNEGLSGTANVSLICAPAGFGKTTLVSEWVAGCGRLVAWLSLDADDSDPARFLTYLIAAFQTIATHSGIGAGLLATLQSSPPPPIEATLTVLLNEVTAAGDHFLLVLDDWHVVEAKAVDLALTFLLEHLPPTLHLVIATREDPHLPLARLRARGQLTELRAADLRFTATEAAEYLNRVMSLDLAAADIATLEDRTEGWIAGLQLAALALRRPTAMSGQPGDAASFIRAFTGSHRFVLDYLVEEVLQQQTEAIQGFLLRTSILDRLCGPLCDAVLRAPAGSGQNSLEHIENANLFIIPLDNERRWYRYHHLFAELLRQRLAQLHRSGLPDKTDDGGQTIAELHVRASQWYEDNGLEIEAFQHAAAANDLDRAARLVEGKGMPLHFRGAAAMVLNWLASLPTPVVEARPALGVMYALALSMTGQLSGIELKLQAAEAALLAKRSAEPDAETRNLIGHIAAIRALLAAAENQAETMITQSQLALDYLHPDNLPVRTTTTWILGWARQLQGDRAAARRAYTEAMAISQTSGNTIVYIWAAGGLGILQEADNQVHQAAQTFRQIVQLVGEPPRPEAGLAYLGLARIYYEWNDLEAAAQHLQVCIPLLQQ
jgi:LuxR family transcriptional regulator, maltose regulon positive regulatory protein